jgi:tungstate transport system substrate-binding protein
MVRFKGIILIVIIIFFSGIISHAGEAILIQSTTSTKNAGFFEYILPIIEKEIGLAANVIAVGTGAAIKNAEKCNGDLLIVHAKEREEAFVKSGYGLIRKNLMYNDFVIIGPDLDPAGIESSLTSEAALRRIASTKHKFASRGDDSGTNIKELELWQNAQIDPKEFSGDWYLEMGAGMGATLNSGIELNAYIFTDRATWLSFKNKSDFKILFQGGKNLFNQYGIIAVSPDNCPNTKFKKANRVIKWITSKGGQDAIKGLKLDGQQLFFPNSR